MHFSWEINPQRTVESAEIIVREVKSRSRFQIVPLLEKAQVKRVRTSDTLK